MERSICSEENDWSVIIAVDMGRKTWPTVTVAVDDDERGDAASDNGAEVAITDSSCDRMLSWCWDIQQPFE